jgi:NAD(P)-dependent dehydrogenase (short-subunit alcohol dehydrogenase family)
MATEWGHLGIRVNAVAPSAVVTESVSGSTAEALAEFVPLRRIGSVDDVAATCVFLASDEASWITGEVLGINGGEQLTSPYLSYLSGIPRR